VTEFSEDNEALAIIESMRPNSDLARRLGPGGNVREMGSTGDTPRRDGLLFAHDEVRDLLRKTRKLLVSPVSHNIAYSSGSRHSISSDLAGCTIRYPLVESALAVAALSRSYCAPMSRDAQYGGCRTRREGQNAAFDD
jgi:hypothetical protein